jgi:hypothetical protein
MMDNKTKESPIANSDHPMAKSMGGKVKEIDTAHDKKLKEINRPKK